MKMERGYQLHGFVVDYAQPLPELKATLYRMHYEKNGADLVWLDRADENKSFAIAFKTLPQDHTGVFHILEHSVLCGSEKFPVKEPFVELLKSSLQTFLNAFTFPDKTMYPFSSRNDQDFLNLMDVYMDAVLHPLSITSPESFLQEGWHYELENGQLKHNGVVYNEMKGAYASPDSVLMFEMQNMLFPDNCYAFESGGHPDHITELTYEQYLASHKRFYHPSNSYILLDGSVDLEAVLAKLDSYLSPYDALDVDADIPMQQPVALGERVREYEVDGDAENKVILAGGWVVGDYTDKERSIANSVLTTLLCSSNESPLKKALLEQGLAEDVEIQSGDGMQQNYVMLVVRNTAQEKKEAVWQTVETTLRTLCEEGLDHDRLHAILNRLEFTTREKDFGSMSRGIIYAINALESWLYGGDPAQNLCFDDTFAALRRGIDEGRFETLLREIWLDNPHKARLTLLPSLTMGEEKRQAEQAHCAELLASWDESRVQAVEEQFARLRAAQEREDTPEQLATMPKLSLSDIPAQVRPIRLEVRRVEDTTLLYHDVDTDGIAYIDLYFSLKDLPEEQLTALSFMATLFGQLATRSFGVLELRSAIERDLGRLAVSHSVYAKHGQTADCDPYLVVSLSLLEHRKAEAVRLLDEVLNTTAFDDHTAVFNLLRQYRLAMEQRMVESGNAYAALRAGANSSAKGWVEESMQGLAKLRWLQKAEQRFETDGAALCAQFDALRAVVFDRSRLTMSLTGKLDEDWMAQVRAVLPEGSPMGAHMTYTPDCRPSEGIQIPAEVGFAAQCCNLEAVGEPYSGQSRVAAQAITFGYLWNTVRVKGGAYGVGMSVGADGQLRFTSYRDPLCGQTLNCFDKAGDALREFCDSGVGLENCIISTIGEMEPLRTPRTEGALANALYFTGRTEEDRQRVRTQVLGTTAEELRQFSHVLDKASQVSSRCVFGGKAALDGCGDKLERRESLQ